MVAVLALAIPAPPAGAATWSVDRTLHDSRIIESSGLVASPQHSGVLWTHNDSGDSARVFAVSSGGNTRAIVSLSGVYPSDIEALTLRRTSKGPFLYAADIGDNGRSRSEITIYKFREPGSLSDRSVSVQRWRLRYPDGAHDAEAFVFNKRTGRFLVVTKSTSGGAIYRVPTNANASHVSTMTRVAKAPETVTDGTFLPDGRMVLRNYTKAYIYRGGAGSPVTRVVTLPSQPQGESIAAPVSSSSWFYIGSEGSDSLVHRVSP